METQQIKELVIISGKGGTGKASLMAAFSSLAKDNVLCDADADAAHFKIPAMVCVNKFDLNLGLTREIETYADENNLACLGRIPFDPIFTRAMIQAQTIFEYNTGSKAEKAVDDIWQHLSAEMNLN